MKNFIFDLQRFADFKIHAGDSYTLDGVTYTALDNNVKLTIGENGATVTGGKVTMQMEGFDIALGEDVTDGSISYNSTTNKFTVKAGTKSYLGEGKFPDQFVAKNDFDISVTKTDDGKFKFSLGDESIAFDLTRNGKAVMGSTITLDGSIIVDPTNNEISLPKDTVITMTPGTGKTLQITALDDAGGELTLANGGLRFKPNENDGALEFNFIDAERKATLDVTGAFTYKGLGALSLEDGTAANLTWTDGTELKITSSGSTGSIGIDPDKGIKITSDDENLDMTLTTPYMSTDISGIKGTIYYKEGNVSFDENSKIIATTTLGGQPILTTLETIDGTGHISFSGTTNGIVYSADTGAMKITWSRGDLESIFTVNEGSIQIGHNLFRIAEGSDIATDLKTFVPALYFTTAEAGTYTINGQKITTSAEGLALTATDDQMVFKTSGDVVEYDGMTFAGNGNVSLSSDNVVLGAGVEAKGFGKDKSFVLAEPGQVTADEKVFELTQVYLQKDGESIPVPMIITVTGAQDGFVFSRTLTEESEEYLGETDSPYVGQVFTEKFIAAGDSSYRIRTDAIGLEEVIGISDGATVTGGASLADEPTLSYYNLVTDTTGKFTIGERTYNVSGDSSIALRARFEENAAPYASMVDSLDGTISGDFSGGKFNINGSAALKLIGDTNVSIVADKSGYEILGLDAGANLQVSKEGTYMVNDTEIAAGESSVIVGTADGKAQLYNLPAELAYFMLHKTEAGYPQMAKLAFHPDEEDPDPPTNYHSAEKWTTASKDDLQLSAIHYSPENPTGKWVILVHGYGKKGAAMNALAEPYLAQGLDVLIVDQRTAGDSEGDWLTMGVAEANDLAIWTQEIAKTNANAQITLHGVSMGAATVMLCAALPETTNLSAMIEDCGYGNIADVFATLLTYYGRSLGVGDVDYYELFDEVAAVAKIFDGGYDVTDAAPIESIAAVTVPSLFIHGAADAVIPSTNADALYEASGASNKTKLIIEGAGHAQSIVIDTEAYLAAVKKLIDSSTTEIGALIDSNADSKVLRGTIYNDTITNSGTAVTIEALGGDDYIENNVDSSLVAAELANSIDAGDGNDTIYSYHTYNPTIYGGEGDDSIVVEKGHKTFADGGKGNDTIIGLSKTGGWGMGDYATILGGEGNDYINPIYSGNASINGGNGNDTILANGTNATIDGGTGKNLIVMTDNEGGVKGKFVVLNGNTTVKSFNTGFESDLDPEMGEGTDTVYITGESPAVDFKADGLTLYYDDDKTKSLTFSDIKKTAKLNLYYEASLKSVAEVFIADDEWYSVTENDLSVRDDSELWFVGATAKMNHGIDFSGISDALNITLNTDYEADVENFRINNIHSIKGGAGLTTITGSDKDDTIIAGKGKTTIDGGYGKNLIDLTDSSAAQIVLNGNTTVEGFATGFGEGSDTIYIDGDPAGVEFKDGVLTFANSTDSLTMSDITKTAKVNIYHERREVLNKGVFIAADDCYKVEDSDLTVNAGEEVYFVGTSADPKTGVDFSGITQDLNVTIDTAYIDSEDYVPTTMWINGVYSLKGGAGNTTITGSDKNDTIIAGTGATTINATAGDDFIRLDSASALIEYSSGDGNDLIEGFNANSTLNISGATYTSKKHGNDIIVTVGEDKITLQDAASLESVNIIGTPSTEEIIKTVTNNYDYGTPITDAEEIAALFESGDLNGDMALLLEKKSADFSKFDGKKNVTLGDVNQNVIFNDEGYNVAVVDANARGKKNISLGNNDVVLIENTKARVSITASNGEDSIFSAGENVTINLDNGGNSWLFVTGGKMTLEGYDNTTGAGFNEPYDDIVSEIADKIANKEITFDDGNLSMGAAVVSFGDVTGEIVNFYNSQVLDELQKVGFASDNAAINTSSYKGNFILVGKKNSTLTSGKGNDTIFADAGSLTDAGAGENSIYIEERNANEKGARIGLDAGGNTAVHNFRTGFDKYSDAIYTEGGLNVKVRFDGENITANVTDGAQVTLESVADDADFAEIRLFEGEDLTKVAVAKSGGVIKSESAQIYIGNEKGAGVDFSGTTKSLLVNLSDEPVVSGTDQKQFFLINQVTAGDGRTTVIGSDANETLIAGKGDNSIYGGGGNNSLQGYTNDDKEGSTTFFVLGVADSADNTIQNFAFVNDDNYANRSADKIEIDTATNFVRQESIAVKGNDVAFSVENRINGVKESVLVKNATSTSDNVKDMRFSDGVVAQVSANDLCFDKFANFFVATGNNATVNVSNDTEYSKVWLDNAAAIENGSDANAIFVGDIRVIDATDSTVTAELAGNDLDNTILAGNGNSSLWGGNGGDDLLVGGESKNTFYYTLGNGNDTVTGVNDGDIVNLAGVSLENIIGADFSNNSLALNFSDGGKLTVNDDGKGVNFVVGDQIFCVNDQHNAFNLQS